jgi:hypothetical protein
MEGALVASATAAVIGFVAVSILFVIWLVTLFLLIVDSISIGAKILWFVVLTILAPIAIPVYLVLRHRRRRENAPAESSLA